jgi:hypothetical protein
MKKIFQAFILAQVVLYSALASATTPAPTPTACICGNGSAAADGCTGVNQGCYRRGEPCDTLHHAKGKPGTCETNPPM